MRRKTEKVLSQFPAQLTLKPSFTMKALRRADYVHCAGVRAGLVCRSPPLLRSLLFSLHFDPCTSHKGNSVTRDV